MQRLFELEEQARNIPLFKAIREKNALKVQKLLRDGEEVNVHAPGGGKTPLHLAVEEENEKIVDLLIKGKADVNAVTKTKKAPLHVAAQLGNSNLIKKLIHAGARVNSASDVGCTALHEAAAKGHFGAVKMLLELKADPAMRDSRLNLTPANLAYANGHGKVTEFIAEVITYQQKFNAETMTYEQKFNQNIRFIIFNWQKLPSMSPSFYQFFAKLEREIGEKDDADAIFLIIRAALKFPAYESAKKELAAVRKLFIANMRQYNEEKTSNQVADNLSSLPQALEDGNQQAKTLTAVLIELGLLHKKNSAPRPIDIILEYCDLPKPS